MDEIQELKEMQEIEKTEETGNVGWTVQCRQSISKAVQESAHLKIMNGKTHMAGITQQQNLLAVSNLPFNA